MMRFKRAELRSVFGSMPAYLAVRAPWQFVIIEDAGKWSVSYRLTNPTGPVSASSTIMGPFDDFSDAADAAEAKLAELRRLA